MSTHKDPKQLLQSGKEPKKSLHTYLRNQNKFYVNSLNMIDRKAAILIKVNSAIISVVLVFFKQIKHIDYGHVMGTVMVLFSFLSLVFAVNASRPRLFSALRYYRNKVMSRHSSLEENMFILGLNDQASLQEYQTAFTEIVASPPLQIGNQVRAMYSLEKQIKKQFLAIEIAYISFLLGLSVVVLGFVCTNLGHIL